MFICGMILISVLKNEVKNKKQRQRVSLYAKITSYVFRIS